MKIGFVLPNSPSYSETFLISKIKGLIQIGFKVIIFTNTFEKNNICKTIAKPKIYKYYFLNIFFVLKRLLKLFLTNPKIVLNFLSLEKKDGVYLIKRLENLYINSNILNQKLDFLHFSFCTMALRRENVAAAIGAKMSLSIRGYDMSIYPLKNPGCYAKTWEKVDKIHTISKSLLKCAYQQGLNKRVSTSIITPSINLEYFKTKHNSLHNIGIEKKLEFLTVSRLHWKKGLDYTLQALALFKNNFSANFNYTIVGEGEEIERLTFTVNDLGLNKSVKFIGRVKHSEIKKIYEKSDIYLQYSIQEGFCNSVLEAQAMGLLVIVSNAEGLVENIIPDKTGWVVKKCQPKLLANKIKDILINKKYNLDFIRINAIKRINENFDIKNQIKLFKRFYEQE